MCAMLWFSLVAVTMGVALAVLAARRRTGPKDAATASLSGRSQLPAVPLKGTGSCDFDIDNEGECQEELVRICGNEFGKRQDVACTAVLLTGASASAAVRVEIDGKLVGRLNQDAA